MGLFDKKPAGPEPEWKKKKRALEEKKKKEVQKKKDAERRKQEQARLAVEAEKAKKRKEEERKKTVAKARLNKAKADALAARAKMSAERKRTDRLLAQTIDPFATGLREAEGFSFGRLFEKIFGTASSGAKDAEASRKAREKAKRRASKKELEAELTEEQIKARSRRRTIQMITVAGLLCCALFYLFSMIHIPDRSEPLLGTYKLKKFLLNGTRVVTKGELRVTDAEFHLKLVDVDKPGKVLLENKGPWKAAGPYVRAALGGWKWIYSFRGLNQERLQLEILQGTEVKILLFARELDASS